jgi:hypothetical protein
MDRSCAAPDCECPLSGCRHDGRVKPAQARFCCPACATRTRVANHRKRRRRSRFARLLGMSEQLLDVTESDSGASLTDLYDRAGAPRDRRDDPESYSDWGEIPGDDDVGAPPDEPGDVAWSEVYKAEQAIETIRQKYRELARPYLQQVKRNPGVRPAQLVALEIECQKKTDAILKARDRAQALERAARLAPRRLASAHERQMESAAARAFAIDLGRGRFLRDDRADVGRATEDIAIW